MKAWSGGWVILAFALLITTGIGPGPATAQDVPQTQPTDTLRILVYNTHHGEGTDGVLDLERIGRLINEVAPDLVALKEIDRLTERTWFLYHPA